MIKRLFTSTLLVVALLTLPYLAFAGQKTPYEMTGDVVRVTDGDIKHFERELIDLVTVVQRVIEGDL